MPHYRKYSNKGLQVSNVSKRILKDVSCEFFSDTLESLKAKLAVTLQFETQNTKEVTLGGQCSSY